MMGKHSLAKNDAELISILRRAALFHLSGGHAMQDYGEMAAATTFLELIDDVRHHDDRLGVRWVNEAHASRGGIEATVQQEQQRRNRQAKADVETVDVQLTATQKRGLALMPLFHKLVTAHGGEVGHLGQMTARSPGRVLLFFQLWLPPRSNGHG